MKIRMVAIAVALAALVVSQASSQEVMYAANGGSGGSSTNPGAILIVDQQTAGVTVVGVPTDPANPEGLPGVDFDSSGQMFAVTGEGGALGAPHLLRVDPADGSLISDIGLLLENGSEIGIGDVSFQPGTDTLYGIVAYGGDVAFPGYLVTINVATGVVTPIGNTGTNDFGGIAFASDGTLYHAAFYDGYNSELNTLNPATGAVLTTVPLTRYYMALGIRPSDGVLFASQANSGAAATIGDIYTIDPTTGAETFVGATGNPIHDLAFGTTIAPPEPGIPTVGRFGILGLVLLLAVVGILRLRS